MEIGKLPPQALEIENTVLGACLLGGDAFNTVKGIVNAKTFYKEQNQLIYTAILNLSKKSITIDILTVTQELKKMEKLEVVGGPYYISKLTERVASDGNIEQHARIIVEKELLRNLIVIGTNLVKNAYDDSSDVFDLIDKNIQKSFEMINFKSNNKTRHIGDVHKETVGKMHEILNSGKTSGIPSGLDYIDNLTNGWQKSDSIIIAARPGMGKAQPYFCSILTPEGFTTFDNIKVGDEIMNSQGGVSKVTGKYPQGEKEYYKVSFNDGTFTYCCKEHLWLTKSRSERRNNKAASVKNTQQLIETLKINKDNRLNHSIEFVKPIQFDEKLLPINPYLLGVIIGDFCCSKMQIMNPEKSLIEKLKIKLPLGDAIKPIKAKDSYSIVGGVTKLKLSKLGLRESRSYDKFIPSQYLNASVGQRTELLQGLIDTDGYVVNDYQIEYSTVSCKLAEDIKYLVLSLGGRCTYSEKQGKYKKNGISIICRKYYRMNISFYNDIIPVSSEKHLIKFKKGKVRFEHKFIENIELFGKEQCFCISTSAEDRLYVTDDFILTHNTAFALKLVKHPALELNIPTAIFSIEMSSQQLIGRLQSSESWINNSKIITNSLNNDEILNIERTCVALAKAPIYIDDTPSLSITDFKQKAKKLVIEHGVQLIVIDYLQLMTSDLSKGNREQEISQISRGIKQTAKELQIPIIALSQLSRKVEDRPGKKPMLADLRESGSLEQDADMVMFLYRPEYYGITEDYEIFGKTYNPKGLLVSIIAKNRHGALGDLPFKFSGQFMRVDNLRSDNNQMEETSNDII